MHLCHWLDWKFTWLFSLMAGFSCFCAGHLWSFHPDCHMPWSNGSFIYWNPCQRNIWMVSYESYFMSWCYILFIHDVLKIHPEFFHIGGGFVFGYLPFQLLYLPQLWSSAQRVHIGYTRLTPSLILFHLRYYLFLSFHL